MKKKNVSTNDTNWELLIRYFTGECSIEENKRIEAWLKSNKRNDEELEALRRIQEACKNDKIEIDTLAAWEKVKRNIENTPDHINSFSINQFANRDRVNIYSRWIFSIAAVLVVFFGLYLLTINYLTKTKPEKQEIVQNETLLREVVTKKGEKATIMLADSTLIRMNSSSKLQYPYIFDGNTRKVYLYGEGYFEVAHNKDIPFIVQTKDIEVKVLGTAFNVSAWPNDNVTDVVVKKGKVLVSSKKPGLDSSVVLTKNQKTSVPNGGFPLLPQNVTVGKYLAWLQGKMIFEKTRLSDVIKKLERQFDYKFLVRDSSLLTRRLTATLKDESLSDILKYISVAMGIKYKNKNQTILFYDPKEDK